MRQLLLLSLLFLLLQPACRKPGCLGGSGAIVTREMPITGSFSQLRLNDNISLHLIQGMEEKIIVTAPQNIIPNIQAIITDEKLSISNATECRWLRNPDEKIQVDLYFKNLNRLEYEGSGSVTNADTLRLDVLEIAAEFGAGNIDLTVDTRYTGSHIFKENTFVTLRGKADLCLTYTSARAQTDMRDFIVKKMVIEYGGLGDTYINATEELDAIIYYKGNVYYKGNPIITRSDTYSSGRLIHIP